MSSKLVQLTESLRRSLNPFQGGSLDDCLRPETFEKMSWKPVHDWRRYVPDQVAEAWDVLPEIAKLAVIAVAEESAQREEWE